MVAIAAAAVPHTLGGAGVLASSVQLKCGTHTYQGTAGSANAFTFSVPVADLGIASGTTADAACTVNAAHVLGRGDRIGRLAPGYRADLVLLDAPDWRYLAYHLGGRLVAQVVVGGELR